MSEQTPKWSSAEALWEEINGDTPHRQIEKIAAFLTGYSSTLTARCEALQAELADSLANHIDANQRNMACEARCEALEQEKAQMLTALRKVPLFSLTKDALGWRCAGCGSVSGIHRDGRTRDEACVRDCYVPVVEAAINRAEGK